MSELTQDLQLVKELLQPTLKRLPRYGRVVYALYTHPKVTRWAKGKLTLGLVYSALPIDLIPGFIPVIEQLDDLLVVLIAVQSALVCLSSEDRELLLQRNGITADDLDQDVARLKAAVKVVVHQGGRLATKGLKLGIRMAGKAV
ncbi:MAG: YkvA family protein, partial [Bacillota bacterium]